MHRLCSCELNHVGALLPWRSYLAPVPLSVQLVLLTTCRATEDGATPESERAADVEDAKAEEVCELSLS